jgi:predicted metalloprotease with PDZ domain
MKIHCRAIIFSVVFLVAASFAFGQEREESMSFTVSMDRPDTHYYHVEFRCEGLKGETLDFKMPAWTPGYYGLMNYAKSVENFKAADGAENPLKWEKTTANTWRVAYDNAPRVTVSYDVNAPVNFAANNYLAEDHGFISPASLFMYVAGRIQHPVTVAIKPYKEWSKVATGLDPVQGQTNVFTAPDFDVLYDCPMLLGNLEILNFEVRGVPHFFAGFKLGDFDREKFTADLKAMIESAADVIGEIPYKHYTFLATGPGQGGIEHANSVAIPFSGREVKSDRSNKRWLDFVSHEFFHLYNIKRIRPIALGPFDYDTENLTNMLWMSEGFTVYYEYIICRRAGFISQEELLDHFRSDIVGYENNSGHLFQSATQSSYLTWSQGPFGGRGEGIVKTISYYSKGPVLGLLLDFKIRHETKNQKSLDDVMRTLYRKFYKEKKRGFTDGEFREVCQSTAGCDLSEVFDYASTVKDIDYPKYLGYAGLEIEMPRELPEANFGVTVRDKDGKPVISRVDWDSNAFRADLAAKDEIKSLDGERVDAKTWNENMASKKPGDKVHLVVSRDGNDRELDVTVGRKMERSFRIKPLENPDPLQAEILKDWSRGKNSSDP